MQLIERLSEKNRGKKKENASLFFPLPFD